MVGVTQKELDELFLSAWDEGNHARAIELLRQGASPEAGDRRSLSLARAWRHPRLALALLRAGARVERLGGENGGPLHWACMTRFELAGERRAQAKLVGELVKAGVEVEARDSIGSTALMRAAGAGALEAALALIKLGADVEARNQHGWSAYLCAVEGGEASVCEALIQAGADWRVKTLKGESALDLARQEGPEVEREIADLQARHEALAEAQAIESGLGSAQGAPGRPKGL